MLPGIRILYAREAAFDAARRHINGSSLHLVVELSGISLYSAGTNGVFPFDCAKLSHRMADEHIGSRDLMCFAFTDMGDRVYFTQ